MPNSTDDTTTETNPSKNDTGWFNDDQQLTDMMTDKRLADTRCASSMEDAQQIISEFASKSDMGAWSSLDRAEVAALKKAAIQPIKDAAKAARHTELAQAKKADRERSKGIA